MCSQFKILLLFLGLVTTVISSGHRCPSFCLCKWKSGKETAECPDKNLSDVPDGIDSGTQVLDLNRNSITALISKVFVNRDLLHLQKLYLEDNSISDIASDAFFKLTNLVELDLSGNQLAKVPKHIFADIKYLRRLELSRNLIRKLENYTFKALEALQSLAITDCHIELIEPNAFTGLANLHFLKLSNNKLKTLPIGTIEVLPILSGIEIFSNPWNCDCQLRGLKVWINMNNIPVGISPTCNEPIRIKGHKWTEISDDDFACPPTFYSEGTSRTTEHGRNVTLECTVHAFPHAGIVWQFDMPISHISTSSSIIGASTRKNLTSSRAVWRGKYYVHENLFNNKKSSSLMIFDANQEDSGVYTCIAENRAGSSKINFTLMVYPPLPEPEPWSKAQIAGVVLGIFFMVVVMFVAICILVLRQRAMNLAHSTKYPGVDLLKHLSSKHEMSEVNAIVKIDKDLVTTTSIDKMPRQENGSSSGYGSDQQTPDLTNQGSDAPYISPSKTVPYLPQESETSLRSPGEQPIPLNRMHTLGPDDRIGDGGRWHASSDLPAYHPYEQCTLISPKSPSQMKELCEVLPKHVWTNPAGFSAGHPGSASDIASDSASYVDESYQSYNSPAHASTLNWKRTPLVIPNNGLVTGHPTIQRYSPDEGYAEETYEGTEV